MAFIIDDIYYQLQSVLAAIFGLASALMAQFIQLVLMPILFPFLYVALMLIQALIDFVNVIIGFVNAALSISNLFAILFDYYFFWIPSVWAAAIYAGMTAVVSLSLVRLFLRVFRG